MDVLQESMLSIADHVKKITNSLDEVPVNEMINLIQKAQKVFVYGSGRSGLVGKAFAIRLMHLGINVFVIGDVINPAIVKEDVLIVISGSGETDTPVNAAKIAKGAGAKIVAITTYPSSTIAKIADTIVVIKGRTKLKGETDFLLRQIKGEHYSLAPLGTLFEVSVLIFLDGLIVEMMTRMGKSEDDMRVRHATIE
ncbi:MAG: 6-phospho-3-hexuloisomerase [Candidatus Hydrothermarchaeales archaeon]